MSFDLVDLRLFVNVADTLGLARGAARSHLSVPAASVRIKHLEEGLGVRLLERGRQGVTLTPAGQAMAHHARQVLQQLEHLRGDLRDHAHGVKGHVRVFASTTAITEYLPAVLRRYLAAHPTVSVDLRERPSTDIAREVAQGKADIGIVSGQVHTQGLEVLPYRSDRLVVAVAPGHAFARRRQIDFADTLAHDQVGLHEASAIHVFLLERARELNGSLRLRIQVGNFDAAGRMIEAGVGIGIIPQSAGLRLRRHLRIRIVSLRDAWAWRPQQICVRSVQALPPFARDLLGMLRADVATHPG